MSSIFEESNMLWVLKNYVPEGENFSAGIHGITLQVSFSCQSLPDWGAGCRIMRSIVKRS